MSTFCPVVPKTCLFYPIFAPDPQRDLRDATIRLISIRRPSCHVAGARGLAGGAAGALGSPRCQRLVGGVSSSSAHRPAELGGRDAPNQDARVLDCAQQDKPLPAGWRVGARVCPFSWTLVSCPTVPLRPCPAPCSQPRGLALGRTMPTISVVAAHACTPARAQALPHARTGRTS